MRQFHKAPGRSRMLSILSAAALAVVFSGCAHTRPKPQVVYHRDGDISSYKRYERRGERDFWGHWVREVYHPAVESDFDFSGEEQDIILQEWGRPDYYRRGFRSLQDERVEEWIYIDKGRVFQFVGRRLVHDGELTDYEQLLLRKGRPDRMVTTIGESGIVRQMMHYRNVFLPHRHESFNLANGWIVHQLEGN